MYIQHYLEKNNEELVDFMLNVVTLITQGLVGLFKWEELSLGWVGWMSL